MSKIFKQKKRNLSDEQIEEYCDSVEQLLMNIHNRKITKKSKKNPEKDADYALPEDDYLLLMS